MNAKRVLAGFMTAALCMGTAAPALADEAVPQADGEMVVTDEAVPQADAEMTVTDDVYVESVGMYSEQDEAYMEPELSEVPVTEPETVIINDAVQEEGLFGETYDSPESTEVLSGEYAEEYELEELIIMDEDDPETALEETGTEAETESEAEVRFAVLLPKTEGGDVFFVESETLPPAEENADESVRERRSFAEGEKVGIAVQAASDEYRLAGIKVVSLEDESREIPLETAEQGFAFLMPAEPVKVLVSFEVIQMSESEAGAAADMEEEDVADVSGADMEEEAMSEQPDAEQEAEVKSEQPDAEQGAEVISELPAVAEQPESRSLLSANADESSKKNTADSKAAKEEAEEEEAADAEEADEHLEKLSAGDTFKAGDYEYTIISGGLSVTKYSGSAKTVTIPKSQKGYNVIEIGTRAFCNNVYLESVTIPASVQSIQWEAFSGCSHLKKVGMPASLKSIGTHAFYGTAITSITIPKNISSSGSPFENCNSLKTVTFEAGTKTIPSQILYNAAAVEKVNIPASVTKIENNSFRYCGVKELELKNTRVESIGWQAFQSCRNLRRVSLPGTLKKIEFSAFEGTAITGITIPKNVNSCMQGIFANCSNLTSVTFEAGMKKIPDHALEGAASVQTVKIPDSVTEIGQSAFWGTSIRSMDLKKSCSNVETIGARAFRECRSLSSITLPAKLKYIGSEAFCGTAIKSITIPKYVNKCGYEMFQNCSNLTSVNFESGMKSIPAYMLDGAFSVEKVSIPASVTKVRNNAFEECTYLSNVTYGGYRRTLLNNVTVENRNDPLVKLIKANKVKCKQEIRVKAVTLNASRLTMGNGQSVTLKASVSPANASNKKVTWKSSNTNLATVSSSGKVTAKANANGTVKITAVTADGKKTAACTVTIKKPSVKYQTYVQSERWQKTVKDGRLSGTQNKSRRLEGIRVSLGNTPYSGGVQYCTYMQKTGWEKTWKSGGATSGTTGKSRRMEAVKIRLTGQMANKYDIYYRVYSQRFGWMGWAKNGEQSGTTGYSSRLEGVQIVLVKKGGKAPAANYGGMRQQTSRKFSKK